MKFITEILKCDKCDKGTVKRTLKETEKGGEIKIYKCTSCKYQHGLSETKNLAQIIESGTE